MDTRPQHPHLHWKIARHKNLFIIPKEGGLAIRTEKLKMA